MLREYTNISKNHNKSCDCLKMGDFVFMSGILPIDCQTGELHGNTIEEQTQKVMDNILKILETYQLSSKHIMRMTIFLTNLSEYDKMNKVYLDYFGDYYPSRAIVGVSELPYQSLIEVNCDVIDTRALEVICGDNEGCSCCD